MANSYPFETSEPQPTRSAHCLACEELLTDALDGTLGEIDQTWFDRHLKTCAGCERLFAEAQCGAAWLQMLKTLRPEPSTALMERILAQTEGSVPAGKPAQPAGKPAQPSGKAAPPTAARTPTPAAVLPFRPRLAFFEPRLAMTAAMALFSLALTMNLTGIQLGQLRPSNLRRTYYESTAGAARFYDNLRVVRVLESRAEDLRDVYSDRSTPPPTPDSRPSPAHPSPARPDPQRKPKQGEPDHGVSRGGTPADRSRTLRAELNRHTPTSDGGLV